MCTQSSSIVFRIEKAHSAVIQHEKVAVIEFQPQFAFLWTFLGALFRCAHRFIDEILQNSLVTLFNVHSERRVLHHVCTAVVFWHVFLETVQHATPFTYANGREIRAPIGQLHFRDGLPD